MTDFKLMNNRAPDPEMLPSLVTSGATTLEFVETPTIVSLVHLSPSN